MPPGTEIEGAGEMTQGAKMQGLPRHVRDPEEILGVDEGATLEEFSEAYAEARTRSAQGNTIDALRGEGGALSSAADVEWAYRELLARFAGAASSDEDAAVSAVLLPGLGADALESLTIQSNVVPFSVGASQAARSRNRTFKETGADVCSRLAENEDLTPLPFSRFDAIASEGDADAPALEGDAFAIPELRDALEAAAASFASATTSRPFSPAPTRHNVQPSHTPGARLSGYVQTRPTHATARRQSPGEGMVAPLSEPGGFPARHSVHDPNPGPTVRSSQIGTAKNVSPARTIRTVIGGEERLVVNVVCQATHDSATQDKLRALISDSNHCGALLRALRLASGVTEHEVCQRIRIPLEQLAAIEEDAYDRLPAPVYYRGFVVSFLKYLGVERLDLAEALTDNYRGQILSRSNRGPT